MPACPDPSTLAAFVEGRLGGATRDQVAAHLDACRSCLDVVASASEETTGAVEQGALENEGRGLKRGDSVGRYLLVEAIGAGAFGEVFAAYDPKLDRKLAIKVVRRAMLTNTVDPDAEARALREAQALARLSHPNVVAVHDVGTADGRMFIAMEHIEGETLQRWHKRVKPGWQLARDVYVAAGRGLAAAHAAGFVHRDFKPANVMLGPGSRVRVLDFGLVRPAAGSVDVAADDADPPEPAGGLETETGTVLGTPAYMAPEQRHQSDVDARADQFALCLSLWESVFGVRPKRMQDGLELKPPSRSASAPKWLLRVLARGLANEPADRFESVAALLRALQYDKRRRRHWAWALSGALVSGAAVASIVGFRTEGDTPAAVDAVEQLSRATRDAAARAYFVYPPAHDPTGFTAYLGVLELEALGEDGGRGTDEARRLRDEFATTLVRLGDTYYESPGGRPFALDYYATALAFVPDHEHALARAAVTPGEIRALGSRARERDFEPAELSASRVLVVLAQSDPAQRDEEIQVLLDADPPIALQTQTRLRQLRSRPPSAPQPASKSTEQALIVVEADQEPAARPEGVDANEQVAQAQGKRRDPKAAAKLIAKANAARRAGNFDQAETLYHRALTEAPRGGAAAAGLARLHRELGHYAKALPYAQAAVKARPKDAAAHLLLGDLYSKALEYGKARAAYGRALELGHRDAKARLGRLTEKTGGGSN